jgi:hypothetical protein
MAFSVTVNSPMKNAERISRSLGIYAGQVTISSYATTLVECTAITKYFKDVAHTGATAALFPHGIVSCECDAISESGFAWRWDATTGAFECYYPTSVAATTLGVAVNSDVSSGTIAVIYGSGEKVLHATSGVGTLDVVQAATETAGSEANANDAVGTVNFIAIGLI